MPTFSKETRADEGWGEVNLAGFGVCLLLFYAIATLFQLYPGGDIMYEMRRIKPTQGIFNLPNHTGLV